MASHGFLDNDEQLTSVSPHDIEWNEVPEAEVRQWFDRHPTLECWLPYNADESSLALGIPAHAPGAIALP